VRFDTAGVEPEDSLAALARRDSGLARGMLERQLGMHYRRWVRVGVASLATPLLVACASGANAPGASPDAVAKTPLEMDDPVARGEWVFHAAGCALCHGKGGKGEVNNANSETGGKITGLILIKEGYSAAQLDERIREGVAEVGKENPKGPVPPLRMPAYESWLSKQDVSDLVAYLFSLYPKTGGKADDWGDDEEEGDEPGDEDKSKEPGDDDEEQPDTSRGNEAPVTATISKHHTRASAR
jgi:mono/diheme cytochrome c family protein